MAGKNEADLSSKPVGKLLISLAVPTITAQIVNMLYNIVDRIYIGQGVGKTALTGVGVSFPILILISAFSSLIGMGGAPRASIRMGQKDNDGAERILGNCFVTLLSISLILTVFFRTFSSQLLMMFGASPDTLPYGLAYINIYVLGTVFVQLSLGLNAFITAQGFSRYSMVTVLIGAVSNIILDPIFIFGFHMGISGAAIATVISQILSCIFAMTFLFGKKVPVKITFGQYNLKVIRKILSLGFSPFLILATDSLILIFMNTVLQKYGGASQGDMLITCATIAQSYLLLITSPMIGISGGTQAILSYNYGARCVNRVKDAERNILGVMLIFTTIMFLLSRFIPRYFVLLFTTDPQYIRLSVWVIRTYTLMIIPLSFQYVFVDGLTALECPKTGLALSVTRKSLFVISAAVLPSFFGAKAAFFAEPVADGISSVLSTIVFLLLINRHLDKRCRMDKKESL